MIRWTDWHGSPPRDGAWREVHLAYMVERGERLWLRCSPCGHEHFVAPADFASETGLDLRTPLLAISWVLRCTRCGERKAHANPEPSGMRYWESVSAGRSD